MKKNTDKMLKRIEWDFDNVPDGELGACCLWEYARESAFIRETLRLYRENWYCPGGKFAEWVLKDYRSLERIQSIGYAAQVFIRGFAFKLGSFPAPWQSLTEPERKYRAHISNDGQQLQIAPISVAHWSWAKEIARECQTIADRQHEQWQSWVHAYVRKSDKGIFSIVGGAPEPPPGESIRPGTRWGLGETLVVDIAWKYFTNDEIATYFRRWAKRNRPSGIPVPSGQGRKRITDRVKLERLAIMRLLHAFTISELPTICAGAWKRYNTPNRRWRKDVEKAHAQFREFFPFLANDEFPLSWPPKGWPDR